MSVIGAWGGNVYWSNTSGGAWNVDANWKGGAAPTSSDVAINDTGATMEVSDGMDVEASRMLLGSTSGTSGALTVTGGKLTLPLPNVASQVGSAAGGSGTLTMSGGELHVAQLQVGAYGTGSMVLSGGTVYSSDWSCIGRYSGGVGTLTITGSGVWECSGRLLFVAEEGTGTVVVENGGVLRMASTNSYAFVLGNKASGAGVLRINTGGTLSGVGLNAKYANDKLILDGGTFVRDRSGNNANFIYSESGAAKFQVGPNGGTIDTSTGTQTVKLNIDNLDGEEGGTLVKTGSGTLVLASGGTFTGGFTVSEGTLSATSPANLPGYASAPITVKSGATLTLGAGWNGVALNALTNRADFVLEEGATFNYAGTTDTAGDYVVDVPSGVTLNFSSGLTFTNRIVKTGAGTLVLPGANVYEADVVVSNGTLAADYENSGLADTHVHLAGTNTTTYCYLGLYGSSFTAPAADSGAGTFSFGKYTGFKAMSSGPFTLNIGGDGRTIKWPQDGDWLFIPNGGPFTVKNVLDVNGKGNFTIKGSGSQPVILEGGITNSSTTAGCLNYWNGTAVLPRRAGGARHEAYRFIWRSGDILITNANILSRNDFMVGCSDSGSGVSHVTLKDCVKTSGGGGDYVNGSTGTVMTVDGGSFASKNRLCVGYTAKGKTGRLVITNNAALTAREFAMYSGTADFDSGSMTISGTSYIGLDNITWNGRGPVCFTQRGGAAVLSSTAIGSNTGSVGRVVMTGGSMSMKDGGNYQIGGRGNGTLIQTGGDISAAGYPCIGRFAGGVGTYLLHGGTFTHRTQSNGKNLFFVAEEGTGTVSIANGGLLVVTNANGSCIASRTTSKGTLILSPGGTYEATCAYGGSGESTYVFNGGAFKALSNSKANDFIPTSVNRAVVTPLGGEIDTNGKGDFTLKRPLTAATRAEEMAESLVHRWRFDGGSLEDCVGDSDATVGGTVEWTDDAVRMSNAKCGTSCINLGTDILPTDGRGATVEFWVTPRSFNHWARMFDFGAENGHEIYLAFQNNGTTGQWCVNGITSKPTTTEFETGKTYYVALVLDPQLDDSIALRLYIYDAATGERLDKLEMQSSTWKVTDVNQANGCWLGHSAFSPDNDPGADYHDVRIYDRAMTSDQLAASCAAGPDAHFYLRKTGSGKLTMFGVNTYTAGTSVEEGTLSLASGATLPATELWAAADATLQLNTTAQTARELGGNGTVKDGTLAVTGTIQPGGRKTIGTLTLDGTSLTSGTLVADIGTAGAADKLVATGTIDVSNLSFALGDATALGDGALVYTVVQAESVTGRFADVEIPRRWAIHYGEKTVRLAYDNGSVVIVR